MLNLPENFKIKITNRYGNTGESWLKNIENIVDKYQKQFQLTDIHLIENLSMNVVLLAKSNLLGEVVIKIGTPSLSSIGEINVMKYYSSDYVPKTYYSSINDKVQVLERIFPGYSLNNLESMKERIHIFSDLSNKLLIPVNQNETFQTFEEIITEKINYAYENKSIFSDILWMIDIAHHLYHKIQSQNLPNYILHNDLHHKNILKSGNSWKAIDPHGIIGQRVFESCNFIRSEIENTNLEKDSIDRIISLVSQYFIEDKKLIEEALYVYIIEKIIFYTKNNSSISQISYNIDVCKKILRNLV